METPADTLLVCLQIAAKELQKQFHGLKGVDKDLKAIIRKCLLVDPKKRPTSDAAVKLLEAAQQKKLLEAVQPEEVLEAAQSKKLLEAAQPKEVLEVAQQRKLPQAAQPKEVLEAAQRKKLLEAVQPKEVLEAAQQRKLLKAVQPKEVLEAAQQKKACSISGGLVSHGKSQTSRRAWWGFRSRRQVCPGVRTWGWA